MGAVGEPPDGELVLQAKNGSLEAFNSLVDRYQRPVYGLCYRFLGNREAAEDATQETFLSAYRAIDRFEGGNLRGWLFRIAANQCRDDLRRDRRRPATAPLFRESDGEEEPIDLPDPSPGAAEGLLTLELGETLQRLLLELPFEQRQAVVLIDTYEMAYEEAAEATATSIGTIKSRVHRGREKLRRLVLDDPELRGLIGRLGE
jgi:RNA polymerase sigma-70 factor (ECF subfamily)